jgi:DNA/RNA-binding domain of Phe-tRNA-synthetase-like protein
LSVSVGLVEPAVHEEFPGLRLHWTALEATVRASPREVELRLSELSDRYRGAGVVAMRTKPIPQAYRAFFRQVGLDPDAWRIPSEEAAVRRLLHGRFRSRDTLEDARLIALVETGVPVWALDARLVHRDSLGIRNAGGRLVVADSARVHATLFGEPEPGHVPGRGRGAIVLFAVGVEGVPAIHLEEALWMACDVIGPG